MMRPLESVQALTGSARDARRRVGDVPKRSIRGVHVYRSSRPSRVPSMRAALVVLSEASRAAHSRSVESNGSEGACRPCLTKVLVVESVRCTVQVLAT